MITIKITDLHGSPCLASLSIIIRWCAASNEQLLCYSQKYCCYYLLVILMK